MQIYPFMINIIRIALLLYIIEYLPSFIYYIHSNYLSTIKFADLHKVNQILNLATLQNTCNVFLLKSVQCVCAKYLPQGVFVYIFNI